MSQLTIVITGNIKKNVRDILNILLLRIKDSAPVPVIKGRKRAALYCLKKKVLGVDHVEISISIYEIHERHKESV